MDVILQNHTLYDEAVIEYYYQNLKYENKITDDLINLFKVTLNSYSICYNIFSKINIAENIYKNI